MFTLDVGSKNKKKKIKSFTQYFEAKEYKKTGISESYFSNGFWAAAGASILNFSMQPIFKGELDKLATSLNPKTDEKIAKSSKADPIKSYIPACFNVPKDVSMLYFLDEELGEEAYKKDLIEALNSTLDYINKDCYYRLDKNNTLAKGNLIVAVIDHETSRATEEAKITIRPDLNIHFHALISRIVVNDEGQGYAHVNKHLFNNQMVYGRKFGLEIAKRLRSRGFLIDQFHDFDPEKINAFSIKGISKEQREMFSKRKSEIDYYAKKFGVTSVEGRNKIALKYRKVKQSYDKQELKAIWKEDGEVVKFNNNYIQSLKTFDKEFVSNFIKSDEELLRTIVAMPSRYNKKKPGTVTYSKIMSKLLEYEQMTGIDNIADKTFDKWLKSGKIEKLDDYNFKCNVNLQYAFKQQQTLKKHITFNLSQVMGVISKGLSINDLIENKIDKQLLGEITTEYKVNKQLDQLSNNSNVGSMFTNDIQSLELQIGLLHAKLFKVGSSNEELIKIRLQIEQLQFEIENLKKKQQNKINFKNN